MPREAPVTKAVFPERLLMDEPLPDTPKEIRIFSS
jgi:hypothetical protein